MEDVILFATIFANVATLGLLVAVSRPKSRAVCEVIARSQPAAPPLIV